MLTNMNNQQNISNSKIPKMMNEGTTKRPLNFGIPSRFNTKIRRSQSVSSLPSVVASSNAKRPPLKPLIANNKRPPVVTRNQSTKRPNNIENAPVPKPKVAKVERKIANWDYKSRFSNLLEQHTKLKDTLKLKEQQLQDTDLIINERDDLRKSKAQIDQDYQEVKRKLNEIEMENRNLLSINANLNHHVSKQNQLIENDRNDHRTKTDEMQTVITQLKNDLFRSDELRRKLHNTVQDLKGNIRVYCRIRPPSDAKESDISQYHINYLDEQKIEIASSKENFNSIRGRQESAKYDFQFDKIFAPASTQSDVFEDLSHLVQSALDGYNVCVFAYGQTGSGKTHTMLGQNTETGRGIIPRTYNMIFERIKELAKMDLTYTVEASFLEIYNENLRDLLQSHSQNKVLDMRFNNGQVTVGNLEVRTVNSVADIENLIEMAQRNRTVAATDFNEHSSRSHAVTKLILNGVHTKRDIQYHGSINLIDLAGSESAKTSRAERLHETKNINKSLSALGNVMLSLYHKEAHTPYRNSKLTFLLQSCLGGNSKTLMFVNVTPFEEHFAESLNSLRFAAKVKEVKLCARQCKTVT